MKRSDFLKTFGLAGGVLILPRTLVTEQKIAIYHNYVRGLQFTDFLKLSTVLKEGDALELNRLPNHAHDSFAIQVMYQGQPLGYIAAYENIVLANMLDQGVELFAFAAKIVKGDIYNGLSIEIQAKLIIPKTPIIQKDLLTQPADNAVDRYRSNDFY